MGSAPSSSRILSALWILPPFRRSAIACSSASGNGGWSPQERCCTDRLRLPARARSAQAGTPGPAGNPAVPFKLHAEHRHHIPEPRYRVTNWPDYDAALRQRGSLTVWFTEEAIAAWRAEPRTTQGGQPHYSALAIMTALTMRAVFRLALRQTEGGLSAPSSRFSGLNCTRAGLHIQQ